MIYTTGMLFAARWYAGGNAASAASSTSAW
jgi:hypothetical protein